MITETESLDVKLQCGSSAPALVNLPTDYLCWIEGEKLNNNKKNETIIW